ncbi:guanylate kinase [Aspergillus sclerotialis]|uniref:Guanylate kinase n=1 Tax=Aspergillus sclerotialis TaxID=2070753 RepID=A0A3A2ZEU7_9EURO|nr:guanylate kinase [Aspergillus sclerotialis]
MSHTTRAPRVGEVEGKNYFFVSPSTFAELVSQGAFVEHTTFNGNQYGTSKKTVSDQIAKGLIVVFDIDIDGVKQMKANPSINARYVFIKPPSFEALEERLRGRGTESDEDVQRRLAQARIELEYANTQGAQDKVIINGDLQTAYQELANFVFQKS